MHHAAVIGMILTFVDLCPFLPTDGARLMELFAQLSKQRFRVRTYISRQLFRRLFDGGRHLEAFRFGIVTTVWILWFFGALDIFSDLLLGELYALQVSIRSASMDLDLLVGIVLFVYLLVLTVTLLVAMAWVLGSLGRQVIKPEGVDAPRTRTSGSSLSEIEQEKMAAHLMELSVVKDLAADTLSELVAHMEDMTFSPGAWVRRTDRDDGKVYWIVEGRVELLKPLAEGGHQLVASLGEGEHFGRVGLMGAPSEHDARAVGVCKILALDSDTLRHILSADSEGHRAVKETLDLAHFLDQVPELSGMGPSGRLDLAAMSIDHRAAEGKNMVVEGDEADSLYVIREGVCVVWRKGADGKDEVLARLGPGQPFGEIGVLFNRTRGASVTCLEDCRIIEIPKRVLEQALRSSFHVGLAFERLATRRMQGAA